MANENSSPYQLKKALLDVIPIKISEGKFYYNFESLQKKGLIEPVETIQIVNRPNKTLYGITQEGIRFLEQEIYNSFKKVSKIEDLYISIYLLKYIDSAKAALFLEKTIKREKNQWEEFKRAKDKVEFKERMELLDDKQRNAVQFISEHAFSQSEHNIYWMEKLLTFLKQISG
ncbi:helix-turn-helix transcriptional regulator [Neobacillus drentensis]|uniref:PadR family transcriptional regulator n=1 Tax=Neobacillus drentensis TaxID=220684 RepID=UPI001F3E344E|nr:helix-turn-helix transcriptional regulator [Neobacillus drentensis]ULT54873.1 helix-turn-helix transcriptional regulator [Neobacillus drentensis]